MEKYSRPWWAWGGHVQTIVPSVLGRLNPWPCIKWRRKRWTTPDGDFIDIDRAGDVRARRLLVLFHGLEGNRKSHYARAFARHAAANNWRLAFVNFRGCSGQPNDTRWGYHAGDSKEIDWILRRFRERNPDVYAVGVSLGGNALLKWLGEHGAAARAVVHRAVAVSAPFNLAVSGGALARGFSLLYAKQFLRHDLRGKALERLKLFAGIYDEICVRAAATLRDFDDAVTAPLYSFRDVNDYWAQSSAQPLLRHIGVPTLVLNARNDPFLPGHVLRAVESLRGAGRLPPEVALEFPDEGGHVGFPGRNRWLERRVFEFLST
jgi:predicted alpha/beta-fold hydrolase